MEHEMALANTMLRNQCRSDDWRSCTWWSSGCFGEDVTYRAKWRWTCSCLLVFLQVWGSLTDWQWKLTQQ